MGKHLLALLFFLTGIATAAAQSGSISGTVYDSETNTPLVGASVTIEGTGIGTATDGSGDFTLFNVPVGTHNILITYIGYGESVQTTAVKARSVVKVDIYLFSDDIMLDEVVVTAYADPESEDALLGEQLESLVVIHTMGSMEMSRKGVGNAEAAVAQVAGVSKQEGAKNVLIRGLGDRYNATLLNGFPVPSEDPEYKNIALEFFGSDIIQNIGINKVFSAENNGDVGGAVIDIRSKELSGGHELSFGVDAGVSSRAPGANFMRLDGVNYLGVSKNRHPQETNGTYEFGNKLRPRKVDMPLNYGYSLSGGKVFNLRNGNPLSLYALLSHDKDYTFGKETVRNLVSTGDLVQDQTGEKSTIGLNQLVLLNARYSSSALNSIAYNFMLLHAGEQYVGSYKGLNNGIYQDGEDYMGYMLRQQSNDNTLVANQLMGKWKINDRLRVDLGAAYNIIKGLEPDRRTNHFSLNADGSYHLTGSDRQKRVFSDLRENDLNVRAGLRWALGGEDMEKTTLAAGYKGRFVDDRFEARNYNLSPDRSLTFDISSLDLDAIEWTSIEASELNHYDVLKNIHTAYAEFSHDFNDRFSANIGVRGDFIDLDINYYVDAHGRGENNINKNYFLPDLNLKYDITRRSVLRFGASMSYILPQAKEFAPYQYIGVGFASEGNPDLKPSDCFNLDLKWDFYPSSSELVSLGVFFKHIVDPIGRVDRGGSAHLLSYDNIGQKATVAGVEFELRKKLLERGEHKLIAGLNASYIYSDMELRVENTPVRNTELEGASPVIANADLTYTYNEHFMISLVANYTSDRIATLGTRGYFDIVERGVTTLNAVASHKIGGHWSLKLKGANLLDPSHKLTQKWGDGMHKTTIGEYKKGVGVSLGLGLDF